MKHALSGHVNLIKVATPPSWYRTIADVTTDTEGI